MSRIFLDRFKSGVCRKPIDNLSKYNLLTTPSFIIVDTHVLWYKWAMYRSIYDFLIRNLYFRIGNTLVQFNFARFSETPFTNAAFLRKAITITSFTIIAGDLTTNSACPIRYNSDHVFLPYNFRSYRKNRLSQLRGTSQFCRLCRFASPYKLAELHTRTWNRRRGNRTWSDHATRV